MAIYRSCLPFEVEVAGANGGAQNGQILHEIAGSATDYILVKKIVLSSTGGGTTRGFSVGLGYSSQVGATPSISAPFMPDDPNSPQTTAYLATQWGGSAPGVPFAYLRRTMITSASGGMSIWNFPRGLGVYPGTSLVIAAIGVINAVGHLFADVEIDV